MADTGAPWNLPYPLATDLVRDGAQAIEDLAEATADGLSAAGGLVAVKHVLKTDTFVSGSVAGRGNVAVTDLEIEHEVADDDNRLIISAFFGVAATTQGAGSVGIAVDDGSGLIGIGDIDGNRTSVTAGFRALDIQVVTVSSPSMTIVHQPGPGLKTYTVRAINIDASAQTLYVGRSVNDASDGARARGASALIIQEVKV